MAAVTHYLVRSPIMDVSIVYDDADSSGTYTDGVVKYRLLSVTLTKHTGDRIFGQFTCPPLVAIAFESTSTASRTVNIAAARYIGQFSYGFNRG